VKRKPAAADASEAMVDPWDGFDLVKSRRLGLAYWRQKKPTCYSVTGIPRQLLATDQKASLEFLQLLERRTKRAFSDILDCGAGVGRNTRHVLLRLPNVTRVDLLEPAAALRSKARTSLRGRRGIGKFLTSPIQEFIPRRAYDLVWIEWVLMYVPDPDIVSFLQTLKLALPAGVQIVVKENVENRKIEEDLDEQDMCASRTVQHFESLFEHAGLQVLAKRWQKDWPTERGYFPLMMWALSSSP